MCYQSFDQEMCIQTNPVILQLHIDAAYIREKQCICGLVTQQFRIIKKTKYVFGVPQKYEYAYNLIVIYKLFK